MSYKYKDIVPGFQIKRKMNSQLSLDKEIQGKVYGRFVLERTSDTRFYSPFMQWFLFLCGFKYLTSASYLGMFIWHRWVEVKKLYEKLHAPSGFAILNILLVLIFGFLGLKERYIGFITSEVFLTYATYDFEVFSHVSSTSHNKTLLWIQMFDYLFNTLVT